MRTLKNICKEINRCQLQIVAIFELPESEQLLQENQTILEGFQMALKNLYHERQQCINQIRVFGESTLLHDQSNTIVINKGSTFNERAFQTSHLSIQQINNATK